jgi:hypothetical protein
MSNPCWGSLVDPCSGRPSREHVVSKCLLGKIVHVRGFNWCSTELVPVGANNITARCLCEGHNNRLSPCDAEAVRVQGALSWMTSSPSHSDRQADGRFINGPRFAKWCAKTACNLQAASSHHVPSPFARYALSCSDDSNIRFYVAWPYQQPFEPDRSLLSARWLHREDNPDACLVLFQFYGLWLILASIDVTSIYGDLMAGFDLPGIGRTTLLNRTRWITTSKNWPVGRGEMRRSLRFLWGEEISMDRRTS